MDCLLAFFFQAGFDHPHMRAPGLPASLTSISGGKPLVSHQKLFLLLYCLCSVSSAVPKSTIFAGLNN